MILLAASVVVVLALGARLARLGDSDDGGATALVRAGLWTCAVLVALEELLGVAGLLGPVALAVGLVVASVLAEAVARRRRPSGAPAPRAPWTAPEVGLGAALVAALASRLWHGLHRTTFLYDTLSYHLHAPATWLHDGRLGPVNAVFGDPAPAYAPSNVELGFLFLMGPIRSDFLAQAGQLPLAALAVTAIAAAVREAGGARAAALASGLAFLLVPEVWQQAPTAMVDVGTAAFLLAALPFLQRLGREARTADAAALGLAVGLAAGSKLVGLVYAAPLVAAAAVRLARGGESRARAAGEGAAEGGGGGRVARRSRSPLGGAGLGAAVAAGGFWYVRNLVAAGNPLFPATLKLGGATLFPGLYDGALLRTSEYHLPIADLGALGRLLVEPGLGFAAGGALALALARPRTWPLLAGAFALCFWLVLPHQESRFLFPLWGVAAVAMGAPSRAKPPALVWVPLALALAGSLLQFPTAERWGVIGVGVAAGLATTVVGPRVDRLLALRVPKGTSGPTSHPATPAAFGGALAGLALAIAAACVLGVAFRRYEARAPAYSVGDDLDAPWAWLRANVRGRRVAYTGNNLPFPLWGAGLANDVRHVNVAGAPGDLAHDCARRASAPFPTPEPAPCREGGTYDTWRRNLRATRREVLFVAALYPGVRDPLPADADAFPIERAWADAHPADFSLRFANPAARVYEVAP